MNNNTEGRYITTNQAQDEPTQPAETTTIFTGRNILKCSCYVLGGVMLYKTFNYATDTSIPLDDRERTVNMVVPLLKIIARFLW